MTGAASPPAVALDRVTVTYGATTALRDVTLQVAVGERVAVLGPSGAGKTTLLGLLNGTVRPDSGTVRVLGQPVAQRGPQLRQLRTRVGVTPQRAELVGPLRVVHNVDAGQLARWSLPRAAWSLLRPRGSAQARAALGQVGLGDRIYDRTDTLSSGQQQRVALARLLVQDPELLLADEPVSGLDPALAAHVLGLLSDLPGSARTLLTSLHDPELAARSCDRLLGLRDGQLVLDAPAAALPAGALAALYGASA